MARKVVTVELDDTLKTIKDIFDHARFHHLLVVESGKLFGVISDRDLLKALSPNIGSTFETSHDLATLNKKAHQIVTRKPVTIRPATKVIEAIELFNAHRISCLPVVDASNTPAGMLTWRDIFRYLGEHINNSAA